MAEAMKLQKMKLMAMNSLHGSGSQNGTESENEELNSNAGKGCCALSCPGALSTWVSNSWALVFCILEALLYQC